VTDPKKVSRHSFYPFISFLVKSSKVRWNDGSNALEKKTKERPIAYAAHVDTHIYAYYSSRLANLYEQALIRNALDQCVIAFRSLGRSNIEFAASAFAEIKKRSECHVICLDIQGFFNNLDHGLLKSAWTKLIGTHRLPEDHYAVFKSLTRYSTVDRDALYSHLGLSLNNRLSCPRRLCSPAEFRDKIRAGNLIKTHRDTKGIPQGSPISAVLSNIYMFEFDFVVKNYMNSIGGTYFRYCDDMLLIVPPEAKSAAKAFAESEIKKLGLSVQDEKTECVDFHMREGKLSASKPMQYLGFLFDGQRIILRSASLARYADRMKRGIKFAKATMKKRNFARVARGEAPKPLFRSQIYKRYTYLGRRNFVSYGYRAARVMDSAPIRKQLKKLWKKAQAEIAA